MVNSSGMRGFQLWINLPASEKMSKPDYQEVKSHEFPVYSQNGAKVKVISGKSGTQEGPIKTKNNPLYLDVIMDEGHSFAQALHPDDTALIYVYEGQARIDGDEGSLSLEAGMLGLLEEGGQVEVIGEMDNTRFILLSAKPLKEPVVRHGPFVMNTQQEIREALQDYATGKF